MVVNLPSVSRNRNTSTHYISLQEPLAYNGSAHCISAIQAGQTIPKLGALVSRLAGHTLALILALPVAPFSHNNVPFVHTKQHSSGNPYADIHG